MTVQYREAEKAGGDADDLATRRSELAARIGEIRKAVTRELRGEPPLAGK
jgi:hypothetical protein